MARILCLSYRKKEDMDGITNGMGSLLFSACAYEGYLNFLGRKLFPSWESFERGMSWQAKTKLIADRIGLTLNEGQKPFQTVKELFSF